MVDSGLVKWIAIGCVALAGCGGHDPAAHAAAPPSARKVVVAPSQVVELPDRLHATGTLRPDDQLVVRSEVAGRIVKLNVDLGSIVQRGQLLAQIDPEDYRLHVEQAEAALGQAHALLGQRDGSEGELDVEQASLVRLAQATHEEARRNFERSQSLFARNFIGRAELETAEAAWQRAESALHGAREEVYNRLAVLKQRKSELALARRALAYTNVVSPIDGLVQVRSISRGEVVAAGTALVTVVDVDPLRLRLDVPDRAADRLAVGEQVQIQLEDGSTQRGAIARLAPMVDELNRTLSVEAEIPNPNHLRPGRFVRAQIELGASTRAVVVPESAIATFAGLEKVLTLQDGVVHENVVSTGRHEQGLVEIRKGLPAGARVLLEPASLQAGDAVEPREAESRAEAR